MRFNGFLIAPIIIGISCFISCSSVNQMALNSTSRVMSQGAKQINHEPNWHMFRDAAPANIKMIESLAFVDPDNKYLLSMLVKAYGGHAFAVHETLYLDDFLSDSSSEFHKDQAVSSYTKALKYGLDFLKLKGIAKSEIYSRDAAGKLAELLNRNLDNSNEEDKSAVFYTAQSLGGLINLQKDNMSLLGRIGAVKSMMDWVCQRDMDFERGSCYLFYAAYEASRPAMLGGDLQKAKKIFLRFMEEYPHNLLGRVSYIQYYVIPMMDEVEYAKQREKLILEFEKWKEVKNAGMESAGGGYEKRSEFNLYNAVAHERFKIIEKNKNNIF